MAVLRVEKKTNYTVIDNNVFRNTELSYRAKGLLCQMLSLPDGWEYSAEGLASLSNDSVHIVNKTLEELKIAGYFRRERVRIDGKFRGVEYIISESPNCTFSNLEKPNLEKPNLEKPNSIICPQLNTNTNKRLNKSKTKEIKNLHNAPELRPTLEEVEAYIREKGYNVDAKFFFDYFEANEWLDALDNPVKRWKAKLVTWSKRNDTSNNGAITNGNLGTSAAAGSRRSGFGEDNDYSWFDLSDAGESTQERNRHQDDD